MASPANPNNLVRTLGLDGMAYPADWGKVIGRRAMTRPTNLAGYFQLVSEKFKKGLKGEYDSMVQRSRADLISCNWDQFCVVVGQNTLGASNAYKILKGESSDFLSFYSSLLMIKLLEICLEGEKDINGSPIDIYSRNTVFSELLSEQIDLPPVGIIPYVFVSNTLENTSLDDLRKVHHLSTRYTGLHNRRYLEKIGYREKNNKKVESISCYSEWTGFGLLQALGSTNDLVVDIYRREVIESETLIELS